MYKKLLTAASAALLSVSLFSNVAFAAGADDILDTADNYMGVPYKWGGTTPSGFDCSGYTSYVYKQNGISIPRTTIDQYKTGTAVSKSQLKPGDIVFFSTYRSGPSHNGIYIGGSKFIHSSSSRGVTISSIYDPYYWGPKYIGARRILKEEAAPTVVKEAAVEKPTLGPNEQYYDVPEKHWAFSAVSLLTDQGIINGVKENWYNPGDSVTKEQLAALLSRTIELPESSQTKPVADMSSSHWAYDVTQKTLEAGIFSVDTNGNFNGSKPLTREEIANAFVKAFDLEAESSSQTFSDINSNSDSYEAIKLLVDNNITNGFPDGTFKPQNQTNRAEIALFVKRAMDAN